MAETLTIKLPNVGDFDEIEIIEVLIAAGDEIAVDDSIIVLESDKATMEIPSPYAGKIKSVSINVGDKISEGSEIATIVSSGAAKEKPVEEKPAEKEPPVEVKAQPTPAPTPENKPALDNNTTVTQIVTSSAGSHASPAVRRFARELGVDLSRVNGSAAKGRIVKEDVKSYVKTSMKVGAATVGSGLNISAAPVIDFSKFGEIETQPLSRINRLSGAHLHRSWVSVPHVTQFDEAEITELEAFRKSLAKEAEKKGVRLTALVFMMKAVVAALKEFPNFNSSLDAVGENLTLKKYFNIGVAVDTPNGLVVPVIRDVDQKGLFELASELSDAAGRARDGKLSPADLQGGCFTISSLGGIGGTNFTPIVNAPEVAILGIARAKMQPVYQDDGSFRPGLILPLALSYDHRVIDGAQGARFTVYLSQVIADIRRTLL